MALHDELKAVTSRIQQLQLQNCPHGMNYLSKTASVPCTSVSYITRTRNLTQQEIEKMIRSAPGNYPVTIHNVRKTEEIREIDQAANCAAMFTSRRDSLRREYDNLITRKTELEKINAERDSKEWDEEHLRKLQILKTEAELRALGVESPQRLHKTSAVTVQPTFRGPLLRRTFPAIAVGYTDVYLRFISGRLIYKPDPKSDNGRVDIPIAALANPLEGTFDLSRCGDTWQHLSISTGYRRDKKVENARKTEIWITPRFMIAKNINATASHYQPIIGEWDETSPIGIFLNRGDDDLGLYAYLINQGIDDISSSNLQQNDEKSTWSPDAKVRYGAGGCISDDMIDWYMLYGPRTFQIGFVASSF